MSGNSDKVAVEGIKALAGKMDRAAFALAIEVHQLKMLGSWREFAATWEVFAARRLGCFPAFARALVDNGRRVEQAMLAQAPPPGTKPAEVDFVRASIRDGGMFSNKVGGEKWDVARTLEAANMLGPKLVEFQDGVRSINSAARAALNLSGVAQGPGESVEVAFRRSFEALFGSEAGALGRLARLGEALA